MGGKHATGFVMKRREFIEKAGLAAAGLAARPATGVAPRGKETALEIGAGPHLLLDDYIIAGSEGLATMVHSPEKLPAPVLCSARFGTTQPYLTVLRDPEGKRLRLWYNRGPAIWHAESADGIEWRAPRLA